MSLMQNIYYVGGWRTTDGRGKRVSVYSLDAAPFDESSAEVSRSELDSIIRASKGRKLPKRWTLVMGWLLLVCMAGFLFVRYLKVPGQPLFFPLWCLLCLLYSLTIENRILRVRPSRLVKAMLARGRCASCGYALPSGKAECDGCTVCTECGCAWQLDASKDGSVRSAER